MISAIHLITTIFNLVSIDFVRWFPFPYTGKLKVLRLSSSIDQLYSLLEETTRINSIENFLQPSIQISLLLDSQSRFLLGLDEAFYYFIAIGKAPKWLENAWVTFGAAGLQSCCNIQRKLMPTVRNEPPSTPPKALNHLNDLKIVR